MLMRRPEEPVLVNALQYVNPYATESHLAEQRNTALANTLLSGRGGAMETTERPQPNHFHDINARTLVSSHSGDGGVQEVIQAMLGIVPGDPEATERNFGIHSEIIGSMALFALAGGNGNNWSLSAHGRYAQHPWLIPRARQWNPNATHRPLILEVLNDREEIVLGATAISGFGLGGAAIASEEIEMAKPKFKDKLRAHRLAHETGIVVAAAMQAPAFSGSLKLRGRYNAHYTLDELSSLEFIGSRTYAKQGKAQVNVDDTRWQPVAMYGGLNLPRRLAQVLSTGARLTTGHHLLSPIDMDNAQMLLQITSAEPVPFHVDGERKNRNGTAYQVEPGQTLVIRLARLGVPTIIVR